MGIAYNTSIVKDGLVLYLDAANIKSYPGTGTTVFNLGNNGINTTLVNGPTVSNNVFTFDGINDYINTNTDSFDLSQTMSVEFIMRLNTVTSNKVLIGKYAGPGGADMWIGVTTSNQFLLSKLGRELSSTFLITDNVFRHYSIVHDKENNFVGIYICW